MDQTTQFLKQRNEVVESVNADQNILKEYFIISKLLERCYINSTDIEYSQFYNKELTLRMDSLINERKLENQFNIDETEVQEEIKVIFK